MANMAAQFEHEATTGDPGPRECVGLRPHDLGPPNRNGNDGTITRFGWKAQNVSLLIFSGEAYNVEMGISNELFQNERDADARLLFRERAQRRAEHGRPLTALTGVMTGIQNFANFQRFLAPPTPSSDTRRRGDDPSREAEPRSSVGMRLVSYADASHQRYSPPSRLSATKAANLFSDLLVHDMGAGLADGVSQGQAGPRDFRTAPLWGVGQRIFFLHDGRTTDLGGGHPGALEQTGRKQSGVINSFNNLSQSTKQDLFNFLRSL